jgi:hypothetical protein
VLFGGVSVPHQFAQERAAVCEFYEMLGTLVKERHEGTACDDDRRDAFRLKPREFQQTGPDEENFAGRAEQVGTECVGPAKAYKEPFDSEQGKPVALEMAEIPSATNIYRHPQEAH